MRPARKAWLILLALTLLGGACRQYLPSNRYLEFREGTAHKSAAASVRGKFNHGSHERPLASAGATCVDCHRFDLSLGAHEEQAGRELAGRALLAGTLACHFCHVEPITRQRGAPSVCATCHDDLELLRPEDHDLAWIRVHASVARTDPTRCDNCHRQADCIACHQNRDSLETLVHERNFRFFHSVEARANPMKCGRCHREDFCIRCHQKGRVHAGEE